MNKTNLRDFFERRFYKLKDDTNLEIRKMVNEALAPFNKGLFSTPDIQAIDRSLIKVHAQIEKVIDTFSLEGWNWKGRLSKINEAGGLEKDLEADLIAKVMRDVRESHRYLGTSYDRYGSKELVKVVEDLIIKAKPLLQKISDSNTLSREIEQIITNAKTGKQAYERLVEVGVNMSDYKTKTNNLPAVVKLSVDPCLINGDCK